MSLLLDALRRAEEAKRARLAAEQEAGIAPERDAGASPSAMPPPPSSAPPGRQQADMELRLADEAEEYPASPMRAPVRQEKAPGSPTTGYGELSLESLPAEPPDSRAYTAPSAASPRASQAVRAENSSGLPPREVAKTVFVAKQPLAKEPATGKKWLLPAIAFVAVGIGAGGWYVWKEISRFSRPATPIASAPQTASVAAPPAVPPPAPATQPTPASVPPVAVVPAAAPEPLLPPLLPPIAMAVVVPQKAPPASSAAPLGEREALAKAIRDAAEVRDEPVALKLSRSSVLPSVSADLTEAYRALKDGNYTQARSRYLKLVQVEPLNIDAHLGLATALARAGDTQAAARQFQHALAIDPRNSVAIAGLLAVSQSRTVSLEVELKTLLAKNPDAAALHFSLGNFYASERRWVEAQQAYFEAYRLESDRPDHVYNLAVSLDHLGKQALARDYYARLLAMPADAGAQFDQAAVVRRLRQLAANPATR